MTSDRRSFLFNVLSIVSLVAALFLGGFYGLVALGVYDPFPAPAVATLMPWPDTPTPNPSTPTAVATWTPTPTPTVTPTPPATNTPKPTLMPSATPTFPPTATPTPRVTRSARPFTYEVQMMFPQYGCSWTGVAGHVQDIDGNPLQGYPVHIWGAGIDTVVTSGADARFNTIYGNQAAWEQFFDSKAKEFEVRVQLHDPYRDDHLPISDEIVIRMPGYCGAGLAYVVFTLNH